MNGSAAIVVRDGVPLERVLRLQQVTLDDVREAAREHGTSNLRDIRLAVLEPDGKFSIIKDEAPTPSQE